MFDYISLIYIGVILLCALVGFLRGGFRTLVTLLIIGASIGIAFLLYKTIGNLLYNGAAGKGIHDALYAFFKDHISYTPTVDLGGIIIEGTTITGETEIPRALWESESFRAEVYTQANVSEQLIPYLDSMVVQALAEIQGDSIPLASPIAIGLTHLVCFGLGFLIVALGAFVIGIIVMVIVSLILKLSGKKKSLLNRLLGVLAGLVSAAAIIWTVSLGLNIALAFDNDVSTYLKAVLSWDDDSVWTFAKWCAKTDLGYSGVLSLFLGQ